MLFAGTALFISLVILLQPSASGDLSEGLPMMILPSLAATRPQSFMLPRTITEDAVWPQLLGYPRLAIAGMLYGQPAFA